MRRCGSAETTQYAGNEIGSRFIHIAPLPHCLIAPLTAFFPKLVRPEGLEPPTYGFEARRSIQLSYGRVWSQHAFRDAPGLETTADHIPASPIRRKHVARKRCVADDYCGAAKMRKCCTPVTFERAPALITRLASTPANTRHHVHGLRARASSGQVLAITRAVSKSAVLGK